MTTPATTAPHQDQLTEASNQPHTSAAEKRKAMLPSLFALIAQQRFFEGLNARQLQLLTDSSVEMQFELGRFIFQEGYPADRFYLILEGKVLLESELKGHGKIPIQTLGPGDELGWSWLFPSGHLLL